MKIKLLTALGGALTAMLSAYAIAQTLAAPRAGGTGDPYDDYVLERLHLNSKQYESYYALRDKVNRDSEEMYKLPTMDAKKKRGLEINKYLREGMRKIFTPKQMDTYLYLWSDEPFKSKDNPPPQGVRETPDWGKSEKTIVASLKLSPAQQKAYDDLDRKMKAETKELYAMWENTDGSEIGSKSSSINRMWNEGIRKIFTPAQLESYLRQWNATMQPVFSGGNPHVRLRPVGRGPGKP